MNELECMRAFVKVVEVGSFAEAARQTNSAKSMIIKRVDQLEEHLELQLIQRSTRRLVITDCGADYYQRCLHLLAELDQAKAAVKSVEWGLSGTFRVSCISSFTATYLAEDLCEFHTLHPDLWIELQQHDRICDPVQDGLDLCIQTPKPIKGFVERVDIAPLNRILVASPEYIEQFGQPNTLQEIVNHRLAHSSHVDPESILFFHSDQGIEKIEFSPCFLTNTAWFLKRAVLNSKCMAMLPVFFIEEEIVSGKLVPILPQYRTMGTKLCGYYRKSTFVPMKVRIFLNFMRRKYLDCPPWEKRLLDTNPELISAFSREGD